MTTTENLMQSKPDISISVNQAFGFDTDLHVEGFSKKSEYVPEIDSNYCFDKATTMAILSGFKYNRSCLLYTSPSPRDKRQSRMPSSA